MNEGVNDPIESAYHATNMKKNTTDRIFKTFWRTCENFLFNKIEEMQKAVDFDSDSESDSS